MQITDTDRLSYAEVHLERALRILRCRAFSGADNAKGALEEAVRAVAYLGEAAKVEPEPS